MKRDFLTDIRDNLYKNNDNIASLIPYLYEGIGYSLQIDAPPLLRKHVAAAILKYKNESVSFEDILEDMDINDFSDEESYSEHEMVRHVIVNSAVMNSKIIEEYLKSTKVKQTNKYLFFMSMGRLSTSFKSATLLLNNGFFVEVVTIFRLIIEQLAWGSFLLCEEDEKKIMQTRTQSTVKYLKNQLGEYYGYLYGRLSSEAHLEPHEIGKYFLIVEDQIAVRDRAGKEYERETLILLKLLEGYCELVWKGMNQFGILETEKEYYTDWHDTNICTVKAMMAVLNDKATLKSI